MKLRIGTRGSLLARIQAGAVAARLHEAGHDTELVVIATAGDRSDAPSFASIGPQGVFVREIERALIDSAIDVAVHSCKDLPTASPAGLTVAAVPPRMDPADVLIVRGEPGTHDGGAAGAAGGERAADDGGPEGLPPVPAGARIGTSSVRRQTWLRHFRPDLRPQPLRGNVPTRLRRLREGACDAIVLAAAGVERLRAASDAPPATPGSDAAIASVHAPADAPAPTDAPAHAAASRAGASGFSLDGLAVIRLDPGVFVPAPAQGTLALQCRRDDDGARSALAPLDDPAAHRAVDAERDLLGRLEGGCDLAFGAWCRPTGGNGGGESIMTVMVERRGEVRCETRRGADPMRLAEALWHGLEAGEA